jgi:negative regulator of sigma E activity
MTQPHDTETVAAYVDGEMAPVQRTAFEAALAADPQLQQAVRRQQALRRALSEAYDPVLGEPVPAALQAALQERRSAQVIPLAGARPPAVPAAPPVRRWQWPEWGAMAACVVVGVLLGMRGLPGLAPQGEAPRSSAALAVDGRGALQAQGLLAQALDQRLAEEAAPAEAVSVGLSFKARDGRYCRSFAFTGPQATAGLACRGSSHWEVVATAAAAPDSAAASAPGSYRMAATALPPRLLQALDELRAGDVLDAAGERAARQRGWLP